MVSTEFERETLWPLNTEIKRIEIINSSVRSIGDVGGKMRVMLWGYEINTEGQHN